MVQLTIADAARVAGLLFLLARVALAGDFTPARVAVYFSPRGGATFLAHAGIQPLIDAQHAIAHSKVMVIDSATIITGSFNFTKKAEQSNAENLLVIKDAPELVKAYEANIQAHAAHAHPYTRKASTSPVDSSPPGDTGDVHGNRHSKVYRVPGCKGYTGMNPASIVPFGTEAAAQQAGYRRAKDCP